VSLPREKRDRSASIVFETNSEGDYRWHLRITQIDCNMTGKKSILSDRTQRAFATRYGSSTGLSFLTTDRSALYSLPAPMGCLQYFTASTGTIESFNFGEYLNNLDYAICVERQPSTCRVIYSASDFLWSIDSALTDKTRSGVGDNDCLADYLMIPAASQTGDGQTFDRYCGGKLNYQTDQLQEAPVISKANGPIVLRFHSDATQDPSVKDGFRLKYEQSSTDCLPQFSLSFTNNPNFPTPVVANLVAHYYEKQSPVVDSVKQSPVIEKQEPIIYLEKREPHVRSNAKQLKI
jgi:hypothetical protein